MVSLETPMPYFLRHVPIDRDKAEWDSLEVKLAMRRVKVRPLHALELAERGSTKDIIAVLRSDTKFFPPTSLFRLFKIAICAIQRFDYDEEKGNVVYQGLLMILELGWSFFRSSASARAIMADSWKAAIGWLEYFYDGLHRSETLDEEIKLFKWNSLLMTTSRFFQLIYKTEGGQTLIYSYDKAVHLTARMWLTCAGGYPVDDTLASQIFSFCSEYLPEDSLDVQYDESTRSTIADLAIDNVMKFFREVPFDFRIFDIHHEVLTTILKNRGCRQLSRTSKLCSRAIPVSLKAFRKLWDIRRTAPPEDRKDCAITLGRYLRAAVYGTFNIWNMKQALRHGLFPAMIQAMSCYDEMDTDGRVAVNQLLKFTFARWLVFPTMLSRFTRDMDEVVQKNRSNSEQLPEGLLPRWRTLEGEYIERLVQLYLYRYRTNRKCCGNVSCRKRREGRLLKCAGCEIVYYCSPECHRLAWVEQGHRILCKFNRSELLRSSLSVRERQFKTYIASVEVSRHLYALRQWLEIDMETISPGSLLIEFCFPNELDPPRFRIHDLSSVAKDQNATVRRAVARHLLQQVEQPELQLKRRLQPMLKLTYINPDTGEEESNYALADVDFYEDNSKSPKSKPQKKHCWRHCNSASTRRLPVNIYPSSFYQFKRDLVSNYDEVDEILCRLHKDTPPPLEDANVSGRLSVHSSLIEKVVKEYVAEVSLLEDGLSDSEDRVSSAPEF